MFVHSSPTAIWHFGLSAGARLSCFVTQLWSWGLGTTNELCSASLRLCPSCPIASRNQKYSIKLQFFHRVLIMNPNPQTLWSAGEAQGKEVPWLLSLPVLRKLSTSMPTATCGEHSLLQLHCGQGQFLFPPSLYPNEPHRICMLRAHRRKF